MPNQNIIRRVICGGNKAPAFTFPGAPYAVYSTRKVVSAFAGKAVQVIRISDSTTKDIGFVGNDFDTTSFNTFTAGTVGYVSKWYDQSGNGRDITSASPPSILVSGNRAYLSFFNGQYLSPASNFPSTTNLTVGVGGVANISDLQTILYSNVDGGGTGAFLNINGVTSGGLATHEGQVFYQSGGTAYGPNAGISMIGTAHNTAITVSSGALLTFYDNGVAGTTQSSILTGTPGAGSTAIGAWPAGTVTFPFAGLATEFYFYNSVVTSAQLASISSSETQYWPDLGFGKGYAPADTVAGVMFNYNSSASINEAVVLGNVLEFEYTQPWTFFGAVQSYQSAPGATTEAQIMFTNVPTATTAFPGYEVWVDGQNTKIGGNFPGAIRVRIIHDIGANQYIGVYQTGGQKVIDLAKHFVSVSYDGSGTAAGIKIYVDGNAVPTAVESDTLGGLTIIGTGQNWYVGNQQGTAFPWLGVLSHIQLDNIVRSPAYIAAHSSPSSLPTIDANTSVCLKMQDGSGTTATDSSGNGHNGTLSSALQWVP